MLFDVNPVIILILATPMSQICNSSANSLASSALGKGAILGRCIVATAVIWLLVSPPSNGGSGFDTDAPLSAWTRINVFRTEAQCEQARQDYVAAASGAADTSNEPEMQTRMAAAQHAQCSPVDAFPKPAQPSSGADGGDSFGQ
jgi:hypothetical protein